jgi:predicted AAA+ superfamily ATPase
MVQRHYWKDLIEGAWKQRSVVWLAGVRRAGKTVLAQSLPSVEYFDCELPRVRRSMVDPEGFLEGLRGRRAILDEVHRLANPSEMLKIAADHYPDVRILATGSSTLAASGKFRDTLLGRKRDVWLTPMCLADMRDARQTNLEKRFLRGGLPPFFLEGARQEHEYQDWIDNYWAKDIQELFRLAKRDSFLRFTELLLAQSGGIFEASRYAAPCEASRPSIANYLRALETTFVAHVIRPFSTRRATEIVSAPKVYGFDTGFVACFRGWQQLRRDDMGILWEHFVINELMARLQSRDIRYWRDKRGHEVDFVLVQRHSHPTAIECKWSADNFDPAGVLAFRRQYPDGENYVAAHDVDRGFVRAFQGIRVRFESLPSLTDRLAQASETKDRAARLTV